MSKDYLIVHFLVGVVFLVLCADVLLEAATQPGPILLLTLPRVLAKVTRGPPCVVDIGAPTRIRQKGGRYEARNGV